MFTEAADATVIYPTTPYFGFDLGYDKKNNQLIGGIQYSTAQYTGNITGMVWKTAYDRKIRKYDFSYDNTSRLTGAVFGQYTGSNFTNQLVNYGVNNLQYDANGNIKTMTQYGLKSNNSSAVIDQLSYNYLSTSNKLIKVTDAAPVDSLDHLGDFQDGADLATEYIYDGNGNMTSDANKKISQIQYNYLNLPSVIRIRDKGSIYYSYDASGIKLRKKVVDSTTLPARITTTLYVDNAVYTNDTLQFFTTVEGRARANANKDGWVYDYFLKDHLDNTRMVITDDYDVASPIIEVSSYYPFGLLQKEIGLEASGSLHNKYNYNNKVLQEDLGLGVYDYGTRLYDAQLGKWTNIDKMTEKYFNLSPYNFCLNNPIIFNDINGKDVDPTWLSKMGVKALLNLLSTKEGFKLIGRFMHKGQRININFNNKKYTFSFNMEGDAAKHKLILANASGSQMGAANGSTTTYEINASDKHPEEIGDNKGYDVGKGVMFMVYINKNESEDRETNTLAHELFVHVEPGITRIKQIEIKIQNGKLKPGSKEYFEQLTNFTGSGSQEHRNLTDGKLKNYKNISSQLDKLKNTKQYTNLYNDDIQEHK